MNPSAAHHSSFERIAPWILLCFFISGLTGLIYEILWTRMIVKIIGGAPFAVSIILTVFMGGLGLGSFLAGKYIDRISPAAKLVKIYGLLELTVGAYALAVPALLTLFQPLFALMYNNLFHHALLYNLFTFVGCSVLLCFPVICMGATLPILCRFYVTRLAHLGTHAGRLYGLNTVGAACGAFICGFWLIYHLGMGGTLLLAVSINGVIGLFCVITGYRLQKTSLAEETHIDQSMPPTVEKVEREYETTVPAALKGALLIFAVSGFCAMAYEVIWTRLLGLIVGPTTYSFTIVLVTFILGLALGSMFFGWLGDKTKKPLGLLLATQIAAGLFALGVSQILGNSQLFFSKIIFHLQQNFLLLSIVKALVLFAFMILPTLCLGATFPLVGKIYTQSISKVGRSIGFAYAINTIGAVLGSFCAGFILIQFLGKEKSLSFVVGLQLFTALAVCLFVLAQNKRNLWKIIFPALPALVGLWLCFSYPAWNRLLLSKGKYHRFGEVNTIAVRFCSWWDALAHGPQILAPSERGELVYYGDGIGGFTTVRKYTGPLGNVYYSLLNSGKPDASSRGDMRTQTLLAHFPMLFHPRPKTVMVLGLASGITAGEVLYYPVEQLDVLDINQQVIAASDIFLPWNNNVLADPRTNLIIQDARAHLQLTKTKYDVVISEPSNPWMAGLATLFTRDFFALVEDRLNPDGIFVQFIHAYEMDWPAFSLVGRTFHDVFAHSLIIKTEPYDLGTDYLLVGIKGDRPLSLENAKNNLPYLRNSKNITLLDPRLYYRLIVSEDLPRLFGPGPLNSDHWPRLEFAAPKLMYTGDLTTRQKLLHETWLGPQTKNIIQQISADIDAQIDFAAFAFSINAPSRDMVNLQNAAPPQKERFFNLVESYAARDTIDLDLLDNEQLKQNCRALQLDIINKNIEHLLDPALSYAYLGDLYQEKNMLDKALDAYQQSLRLKPHDYETHFRLATLLSRQGKIDEAIVQIRQSLQINPFMSPLAHQVLGHLLSTRGDLVEADREYLIALEMVPDNPVLHNDYGVVLAQQGKMEQAVKHFRTALKIQPEFPGAQANLNRALSQQP